MSMEIAKELILIAKKLRLETVMQQGKKTRKQQEREKNQFVREIGPELQRLTGPNSRAKQLVDEVIKALPGRMSGMTAKQRKRLWVEKAKMVPEIIEFTEAIGGPRRMYDSALYIVRDVALGLMKLSEGKAKAINMADKWFMENAISSEKNQFEEGGYAPEFSEFLPPKISFKLGPTRNVLGIVETFGREKKNWETMAKKLAFIAENFNDIVREVKKDMRSSNDEIRLCALMTAITIETGLRPGKVGNMAKIKDPDTGEEIEIETFGVTTMQPRHVKFIRDGFAEIRFIGKMGAENVAELSDDEILKALQEALASTTINGSTSMMFVTKGGQVVDDSMMRKYVTEKWGDITPTDFRKLKATRVFYEKLKARAEQMRKELAQVVISDKQKLKGKIVARIMEILENAAKDAQEALSHDDWKTTVQSYVDPRVVVNFLNQGGLDDALEDILVENKNVNLMFDFNSFVNQVKTASPVVVLNEMGGTGGADELFTDMDKLLENLGV